MNASLVPKIIINKTIVRMRLIKLWEYQVPMLIIVANIFTCLQIITIVIKTLNVLYVLLNKLAFSYF